MTPRGLERPASAGASRETGHSPAWALRRRPAEPAAQHAQRPIALTLAVLNDLAESLACEGIEVRGAFARMRPALATRDALLLPKPPCKGEDFVGHFTIPTTDNDGNPFSLALLLSILRELYERTGGVSFREAVGLWRDEEGACYVDLLIGVEVWTSDREGLVAFIRGVCGKLGQKCIPLRIERAEFVWIEGPGEVVP